MVDREEGQGDKQGQMNQDFHIIEMKSHERVLVWSADLRSICNNLSCLPCRERALQIQEQKCSSGFP